MSYIALLSQYIVMTLLAIAAWQKLRTLQKFRDALSSSFRLPQIPALITAWAVISIEISLAIFLFTTQESKVIVILLTLALFLCFLGFILFLLFRPERINCHCFGEDSGSVSWSDFFRGLILVGICILMFVGYDSNLVVPTDVNMLLFGCALMWSQVLIYFSKIVTVLRTDIGS